MARKQAPLQAPNRGRAPQQQQTASAPAKNVKVKKPMTKGGTVAVSIIVSFILLLIFSVGLILFATMRTASEQATYSQMLSDAENQVREASVNVAFSPAQSIRDKALSPSVNFEVVQKDAAQDAQQQQQPQQPAEQQQQAPADATPQQADPAQQQQIQQQADAGRTTSFGAGVIVSQQGDTFYVLTNHHVIQNAAEIKATVGGETYKGEVVGFDETSDLAIVSIQAKGLSVAQIGISKDVSTGDFTMSVGNPYGLNSSMSTGIISATGRNMTYANGPVTVMYANMLQTDAAINPGNSGGGLFDASGNLIGINTLVGGDASHSDKIGYAIPTDFAIPIAKNLIAGQKAAHASFGIAMSNVPDDAVAKYGLASNAGAYVNSVTPSGPAEIAGIVPNDIIVSYDGRDVESAQDMLYKIRASVINDTKEIKILREGKEMTLSIKVGSDV